MQIPHDVIFIHDCCGSVFDPLYSSTKQGQKLRRFNHRHVFVKAIPQLLRQFVFHRYLKYKANVAR